jgi:hypothetical protein
MLRSVKSRTGVVVGMFVAATLTLCSGVALAVWSSTSSTSISSPTDALSTPSLGAVSGVTSSGATINWSDPGSWQSAATYTATATASGHTTQSCSALASALSCALTGLDAGITYSVSVSAKLNNWVSSAATTTATPTASDTTAPTLGVTFPAANGHYNTVRWAAGCTVAGLCGMASDPSGVASVQFSLRKGTTGSVYWNGTAFATTASEQFLTATGTTSWSAVIAATALTNGQTYTLHVKATDGASPANTTSPVLSQTFVYDTTAPGASGVTSTNHGTAGTVESGDVATLSYSEQMDPTSLVSGWDGSSMNVVVRGTKGGPGTEDTLTVFDSTNTAQVPLGTVGIGATGYFSANVTYGATGTHSTMSMDSAGVVTITLGTVSAAGSVTANTNPNRVDWTPSATATDLAGNACSTTKLTPNNNVVQF